MGKIILAYIKKDKYEVAEIEEPKKFDERGKEESDIDVLNDEFGEWCSEEIAKRGGDVDEDYDIYYKDADAFNTLENIKKYMKKKY